MAKLFDSSGSDGLFGLSWMTIILIAVAIFVIMYFRKKSSTFGGSSLVWVAAIAVFAFFFLGSPGTGGPGLGDGTDNPNLNSCGCGPDQLVEVGRKRWLSGKVDSIGAVSCNEALRRSNRWGGDRWTILGCYNA